MLFNNAQVWSNCTEIPTIEGLIFVLTKVLVEFAKLAKMLAELTDFLVESTRVLLNANESGRKLTYQLLDLT